MTTISFRTEDKTKQKLDFLASQQNRDRSYVINQAIECFISLNEWQFAHIENGLKQACENDFADEQSVVDAFAKWKSHA